MNKRIYIQFVTHYHIKISLHITLPTHDLSSLTAFPVKCISASDATLRSSHSVTKITQHRILTTISPVTITDRISTASVPPTVQYSSRAVRMSLGRQRRSLLWYVTLHIFVGYFTTLSVYSLYSAVWCNE